MNQTWTARVLVFFLKIIFDIGPKGKLGVKETRADKVG